MLNRISILVMLAGFAVAAPASAGGMRIGETRPELMGFSSERLARLDSTIEAAIRAGASPGAALAIGRHGEMVRLRGYGRLTYAADAPAVTDSTIFDIASLTKVVGTTTAIMQLIDAGRLDLDVPIAHYLRSWPSQGYAGEITLRHLLTHTSGLPAGADLWTTAGREAKISRIAAMKLAAPPGTQTVYSDLGMIVTGAVVESVTGERLDDYLEREVFAPLRMNETFFNASDRMIRERRSLAPIIVRAVSRSLFFAPYSLLADWAEEENAPTPMFARVTRKTYAKLFDMSQVAPTEFSTSRGEALQGHVHDPNAAAFDGVAGHAGLFSSARDLAVFAQLMLNASAHKIDSKIVKASTVDMFVARSANGRALGWDMPNGRSSAGNYFPASAYGHTGFTGTSIWIDPENDLFVVLLTNRVYPTASNKKHIELRRAVHDAVELAVADEVIGLRLEHLGDAN
jgi:CubicO group peptidase (beta-lactamase class C family)